MKLSNGHDIRKHKQHIAVITLLSIIDELRNWVSVESYPHGKTKKQFWLNNLQPSYLKIWGLSATFFSFRQFLTTVRELC